MVLYIILDLYYDILININHLVYVYNELNNNQIKYNNNNKQMLNNYKNKKDWNELEEILNKYDNNYDNDIKKLLFECRTLNIYMILNIIIWINIFLMNMKEWKKETYIDIYQHYHKPKIKWKEAIILNPLWRQYNESLDARYEWIKPIPNDNHYIYHNYKYVCQKEQELFAVYNNY